MEGEGMRTLSMVYECGRWLTAFLHRISLLVCGFVSDVT